MTLVDIDAVAPGTLTPWKEDLLWRLYVDAYNHLTLGYADELIQKDQADRSAVHGRTSGRHLRGRAGAFSRRPAAPLPVGLRPRRRSTGTCGSRAACCPGEVHASLEKRDDVWELTVAALDKPFLFSNIAGVLSYFGMNIHRGQAMTTPDHLVLDVFEFSDEEGFLRQNAAAREEIARVLKGAVAGTVDVRALLTRPRAEPAAPPPARRGHARATRQRALAALHRPRNRDRRRARDCCYRISRAISEQGCDVDLVLISTEGHKAIDVLHVTKPGRKLDAGDQALLKRELERTLEGQL